MILEKKYISGLIPARENNSYKGNYGHVLIVAGSRGKTGAALLAAKACIRAGAGLVTLGVPESLMDIFQSRVTEEMVFTLPDKGDGSLSSAAADVILRFLSEKADVLCIGPGIGVSVETCKMMEEILLSSTSPMVIDADGINSISQARGNRQGAIGILNKAKAPVILTPHTGEMARLLQGARGRSQRSKCGMRSAEYGIKSKIPNSRRSSENLKPKITEIELDRIGTAVSFSKETGTCLVLKGVPTVIAEPGGRVFINQTGNPGMATAGTGDVLAGMVSSLLGQGLSPVNSAVAAVYMHGLAGDIAAREKSEYSLIASDIIDALPAAFKELITA